MTIGLLQLSLFIPGVNSLKSKRQIIKSLKDKIRHKFNVSIAEASETQDKWQRQDIFVACINSDQRLLNSLLAKIVNLVEAHPAVEIIDHTIEMY
ncbi:DUF503 domain-containing protein [Candidatus Omnitrophota bacterium]